MNILIRFWIGLAIVLPALLGALMIANPDAIELPGDPVPMLVGSVAVRNLVFSILTLLAYWKFSKKVLALLIFGRGLTDAFDALAGMVITESFAPVLVVPLILAVVSFVVAKYLYYEKG